MSTPETRPPIFIDAQETTANYEPNSLPIVGVLGSGKAVFMKQLCSHVDDTFPVVHITADTSHVDVIDALGGHTIQPPHSCRLDPIQLVSTPTH